MIGRQFDRERMKDRLQHARESILDVNDGIVSAAGIAEGFASAGASAGTLLIAGVTTILAGGSAAAGARYTEVRTEWEMNRAIIEQERASIEADPEGELEELVEIYAAKGLEPELARQVAQALTERDPVAAHADAELNLAALGATSGGLTAGIIAGLSYGAGAALPLAGILFLPVHERMMLTFVAVLIALALTGWFASWLTGLAAWKLMVRNVLLGTATMAASLLVGLLING
ncbi:VIT family protein [Nakamurella silvestris]|nr:VIT family protein [Nakamurella silvestris]